MFLKEKITSDLKEAQKEKKELEVSVLRLLQAAVLNKEKEKRTKLAKEKDEINEEELEKESQLTDDEIIEVVFSETKKRKEAILEFSSYAKGYGGPAEARSSTSEGGEKRRKEKIDSFIKKEKKEMEILKKYLPEQLSKEEIKKLVEEVIAALRASLAPSEREKIGQKDMGRVMRELVPKIKGKAEGGFISKIVKELLT